MAARVIALLALSMLALATGCSGSSGGGDIDGGADAGTTSDAGRDAGPFDASPCGALGVSSAAVDLHSLRDTMVMEQWARGHTGANGDVGQDNIFIHNIDTLIDVAAPSPTVAAGTWLEALDSVAFVASELSPEIPPDWSGMSVTLVLMRTTVDSAPTRFARPAVSLHVLREPDGWHVQSLTLYSSVALATRGDVETLVRCTPSMPPSEAAVRATTFMGLRFRGCAMTGTYSYTPAAGDVIAWLDPVTWEALDDAGTFRGRPTRWRIARPATFTIAPANYWADIGEADCLCGDSAGYELVVDVVSGEVIRYRPGIRCVVC